MKQIGWSLLGMMLASTIFTTTTLAQDLSLDTLSVLGRTAFQEGNYAEAERYYRLAVERADTTGAEDSDRAAVLQDLATLFQTQARYEESERLFQRVLVILRTSAKIDRRLEPIVLTNLATLYRDIGKTDQAESLLNDALRLMKRYLDPQDARVSDALNNLAVIYSATGRLDLAEKTFKQVVVLLEKRHAAAADLAPVLTNLAALYVLEKKWQRAEPLIRRASSIFEEGHPPNEPDFARLLNALGLFLLTAKADLSGAESVLRRSIEIRQRVLGPQHPSVATVSSNLADVLREAGKYEEAQALYAQALQIDERTGSLTNLERASTLDSYAFVLRKQKNDQEAEEVEARAKFLHAELRYVVSPERRRK